MKYLKFTVVFVALAMMSCNQKGVTQKELKTEVDSASYALGLNMGSQMKVNFSEINVDFFKQGFSNGLDSTNFLIEPKDAMSVLSAFSMKKQAEQRKKMQEEAIKKAEAEYGEVKKASEAFLAENKTKEGVKTTESGLQYKVLKEGSDVKLQPTDRVKVHYHGTLIDGTVFDSSVERNKPYETFVNRGVIQGWLEAFKYMNVGSKFRIFVPHDLAYGATPRPGGKIRPFDALIFDVEILEIVK